jgi:hypothetical protein
MKRFFAITVPLSLCLLFWFMPLHAAPAVDGFAGVPWGASKKQVQKVMKAKGYAFLEEQTEGSRHTEKYKGAFAGEPADLIFSFKNNLFCGGTADILAVAKTNVRWRIMMVFNQIKQLIFAKYGPATTEEEYVDKNNNWVGYQAKWKNLAAAATPPGLVEISLRYGKFWDLFAHRIKSGLHVDYSIGENWANMKAGGGGV